MKSERFYYYWKNVRYVSWVLYMNILHRFIITIPDRRYPNMTRTFHRGIADCKIYYL